MGKPLRLRRETKPAPSTRPQSNPSKSPHPSQNPATGLRILLHLAQRHPILLWVGVWLSMAFVSWVAIVGLTYTNTAPLEVAEKSQPEVVKTSPNDPQIQPRTPATSSGLLAAVVASCAATTVLLARQLNPVKPTPRRFTKRSMPPKPAAKPMVDEAIATAPPTPSVPPTPLFTTPIATDTSRAKEWEAAKLADMLDLRQQSSVPSQQ